MYDYSWIQWVFLFLFYCLFGWCFESTYVSLKNRKFVNRGFMRGPFLPIYGSGALMMLIVSRPVSGSLVLTFLAGCVGATVLEYVTGVAMEALFKVRYWDYSDQKFNFQGHICLSSSLAWGGLTILMTRLIHRPVEKFMLWLPESVLTALTMLISLAVVVDFTLSFKAAMDLRDVLIKMEQAKRDLARMQKRLDVIIALTDEALDCKKEALDSKVEALEEKLEYSWEEFLLQSSLRAEGMKENYELKREELTANVEERLEHLRSLISESTKGGQFKEHLREELAELRVRYRQNLKKPELTRYMENVFRRSLVKGNPSMSSKRFAEALEELKQSVQDYRKKKEDEE